MDKFDESIRQAKQTYEPRPDFIDATMRHIGAKAPRRRWNTRLWAPTLVGGLVVIALIFIALPSGSHGPASSTNTSTPTTDASNQATTMPAGTSNAELTSDLDTINGQISRENADQNNANAALNDKAQEITVPTD